MKPNFSLAAILSTAALSGLLLASFNPASASGCPFSKGKGTTAITSGDSSNLLSKKLDLNNMGIAGAGIGTVAGIVAAGIVYQVRRSRLAKASVADVPVEQPEDSFAATSDEFLNATTSEENVSVSKPDRDLTLVG